MTEIVASENVEVFIAEGGEVVVITTPETTVEYITAGLQGPAGPPGAADKLSRAGDTMDAGADLAFSGGGEVKGLPSVPLTSSSASSREYTDSIPGVIPSIATVINYGVGDKTLILVNSTNQVVEVQLPDVAGYIGKHFHVKWWKGSNDVVLKAAASQTVEEEDEIIFGERLDSLHVVGVSSTEWAII